MYTTRAGQQWDEIALEVYGDEERADILMQANPRELGTYQFSAGVVLNTPELEEEQTTELPPWR
jgi:hypothetical protein